MNTRDLIKKYPTLKREQLYRWELKGLIASNRTLRGSGKEARDYSPEQVTLIGAAMGFLEDGYKAERAFELATKRSLSGTHQIDPWMAIKHHLAERLNPRGYEICVSQTQLDRVEGTVLRVIVPDGTTKQWMEQEYAEDVRRAIHELNLEITHVIYAPRVGAGASQPSSPAEPILSFPTSQLNQKFSFDNFVVGSSNLFAHAAALAVANSPSRSYNPLFVYGGVGMGKTHLLHAIGRSLLEQHPGLRIVYTASERFMNEMISCIKSDRMQAFHRHYRSADVLLIDDIQILSGRERTQEEFFHTFNELYEHKKQIVISSDSAPKSTPGLVERLRSRFEWGLIVDIQPPDLETKIAILDKKAEAEGVMLPEDVRVYIATKTKSNIRELEGALVRLVAYSSVTGEPITLALALQVLKYEAGQERRVTMDSVLRAVAERFQLGPAQLKVKTNAQSIAFPRQIAMYLMKELTQSSLAEIGHKFGGKHQTTVLHSVAKIERLRQKDVDLNRLIQSVIDSMG